MRCFETAVVALLALGLAGAVPALEPPAKPVPPGLAKRFGPEVPEEPWIAFHPTRDDGAWFLIDFEWTLVTGFSAQVRAEVREARTLPAKAPPIPPPNVGAKLHVVLFERP